MKKKLVSGSAVAALLLGAIMGMGAVGGFETGTLTLMQFLARSGVTVLTFWIGTCLFDYARYI